MIEQTREIVHKFNSVYGQTLVSCCPTTPPACACREPTASQDVKSLGNCIYL